MNKMKWVWLCVLAVGCCVGAFAQSKTATEVLDASVKNVESEFVPAVEAMPEDKFDFAPSSGEFKGVRTFAMQAKHVAAVNYLIGSTMLGEKSPVDVGGENGPDSIKSKADVVKFVKDSFAYAHKAVAAVNDKNLVEETKSPFGDGKMTRLAMAEIFAWHAMDHYGQMVVYLRMNGIVPPASRK
ncbi:MAG TPA: DinB family protein [Terriglobales bacterium]|nr:DinB family protein [Terriglobales bacterium]